LNFDSFCRDTKTQDAIIKNFIVIGEAVNKIPKEFFTQFPDFPTKEAIDMRNFLIHDYDNVDLGILWKTINNDIPSLKIQISKALNNAKE